jgi:type IV pilus assembly protein PilW
MAKLAPRNRKVGRQSGLTLIEFLIAIVIGMILVAAIGTLIANQSANRSEIDRAGKLIENGRFAVSTIASDAEMAGYWGEMGSAPPVPSALPDPCSVTVSGSSPDSFESARGVPVQGYDSLASLPANLAACITNWKIGTDILVIRKLDPDTADMENPPGAMDLTKAKAGQVYLQTGLDSTGTSLTYAIGASDPASDATTFALKTKSGGIAALRKYVVHIYYISQCSVEVSGSCTNADGGTPIPTLKRVELSYASNSPSITCSSCKLSIAEGIENMQIDYGIDTDSDGLPNGADSTGAAFTVNDWASVMSLKIHLLARATEKTPGYTDTKSYALGASLPASAASAANDGYPRHVFVQSVRLVNPSARRVL